jgi:torulene dioxygenase
MTDNYQFQTSHEQRTPVDLVVKGKIPAYAAGTLYRTGPSSFKVGDTPKGEVSRSHWFDGFTQIYRFQIVPTEVGSCKVTYNSRRQVDALIEKIRKTGDLSGMGFGQKRDPCQSLFQKLKTVFQPLGGGEGPEEVNIGVVIAPDVPGYGNTNVPHDGQQASRFENLVVFTDFAANKKLDPDTLEPAGVIDQRGLHPDLKGPISAAHAQFDHETGDVLNFNMDFTFPHPTYRIFKNSRITGKTEILATIKDADLQPAYIHSSFLTPDYFILGVYPAFIGGLRILWERNMLDAISKFDPKSKTVWAVIDRKHGRGLVAKFTSPPGFMFHSINAWEESEDGKTDIVCDMIEYKNLDILHRFYYDNLLSTSAAAPKYVAEHQEGITPHFVRYRLPGVPSTGTTSRTSKTELVTTIPGPLVGELPTSNPNFQFRQNRYTYSVAHKDHSSFFDCIAKTDINNKTAIYWEHPHHTPGEPIFVPNPKGTDEDDGVLLAVILDGDSETSYLLCLDARDLTELGRAEVNGAVGFGFHGRHIPFKSQKL